VVYPCDRGTHTLIREAVGFASRSKLDGVIILPPISEDNDLAGALAQANLRYVRLAAIALDSAEHVVILNERSGAATMAAYLAGLGHRTIGYITGPEGMKSTRERLEGFCDALERQGCPPRTDLIARGAYSFQSGVDAARLLLDRPSPPTAIFASNDEMAAGVIYTARQLRLDVPGDVSVAGFDDSPLASRIVPSLTTIRRPEREMARLAATKLIAFVEGRDDEARQLAMLEPSLVIRDSTRAIT
jgi:LacI family transcriptional regulator